MPSKAINIVLWRQQTTFYYYFSEGKKIKKKIEEATQQNPFHTLIDMFIFLKQTFIPSKHVDTYTVNVFKQTEANKQTHLLLLPICRVPSFLSFFYWMA